MSYTSISSQQAVESFELIRSEFYQTQYTVSVLSEQLYNLRKGSDEFNHDIDNCLDKCTRIYYSLHPEFPSGVETIEPKALDDFMENCEEVRSIYLDYLESEKLLSINLGMQVKVIEDIFNIFASKHDRWNSIMHPNNHGKVPNLLQLKEDCVRELSLYE